MHGDVGGEAHEAIPFVAARRPRPRGAAGGEGVEVCDGPKVREGLRERSTVTVRREAVDEESTVRG